MDVLSGVWELQSGRFKQRGIERARERVAQQLLELAGRTARSQRQPCARGQGVQKIYKGLNMGFHSKIPNIVLFVFEDDPTRDVSCMGSRSSYLKLCLAGPLKINRGFERVAFSSRYGRGMLQQFLGSMYDPLYIRCVYIYINIYIYVYPRGIYRGFKYPYM